MNAVEVKRMPARLVAMMTIINFRLIGMSLSLIGGMQKELPVHGLWRRQNQEGVRSFFRSFPRWRCFADQISQLQKLGADRQIRFSRGSNIDPKPDFILLCQK